jgi:hypothetical protein
LWGISFDGLPVPVDSSGLASLALQRRERTPVPNRLLEYSAFLAQQRRKVLILEFQLQRDIAKANREE